MNLRGLFTTFMTVLTMALTTGCFTFHRGPMPGEPKGAQFADVDGVRVRYVEAGPPDAPPVVLVHGFASSLETWLATIPELAKKHRVLAMDLKGFGWTDRPEGNYSPAAQAEMVMKLAEQRGITRAAFVGHSFGSSVVLQAALNHPERVERIALYDAFVYEEQIPSFFHWAKMSGVGEALFALFYKERPDERIRLAFYDQDYVTEDLVEGVERALDRPGTLAAALQTVRELRYDHVEDRYRTIGVPVLLMWGRDDTVTPVAISERLSRDLRRSRVVVYPRCGHFPMIEAAAQSNLELAAFLDAKFEPLAPGAEPRPAAPGSPEPKPTLQPQPNPEGAKTTGTKSP